MPEDIRATIRKFISNSFPQISPDDEEDLFRLGFINSLYALELLTFIEKRFAVQIGTADMRPESFHSIGAMSRLVERLTGAQTSEQGVRP